MFAADVCRVVEHNGQGVPSLVHALSTLAAYWRLCECGLEIGRDGKEGWQQKCERLESELYPLQGEIELLEKLIKETSDPPRLLQQETKLGELQAKLSLLSTDIQAKEAPIDAEWEQAHNETEVYRELLWDAREFCTKACGIGDNEVFNAALVGFDPSQLKPGQEPSKQRMPEIVSLLRNLQRHEWETQPWANPTKPTMRARRRVTPERLNLFNVRNLKESIADPILQPTTSVKAGGKGGKADDESGLTTMPNAETLALRNEARDVASVFAADVPTPAATDEQRRDAIGVQVGQQSETIAKLEQEVSAIKRKLKTEKPPTRTEVIRNQRIQFSCPRRCKELPDPWSTIWNEYRLEHPEDKKASPDTLLKSHDRNCEKCQKGQK